MDNKHYVYVVKHNEEIVYIGKGKDNRYMHINSGCSHVYEANRLHHVEGVVFDVDIIKKGLSAEKASEIESLMIRTYSPIWNKQFTKNDNRYNCMKAVKDIKKKIDSDLMLAFPRTKYISLMKLSQHLAEILYKLNSGKVLQKVLEKLYPKYKPVFRRLQGNRILDDTFISDLFTVSRDDANRRILSLSEKGFEYIKPYVT